MLTLTGARSRRTADERRSRSLAPQRRCRSCFTISRDRVAERTAPVSTSVAIEASRSASAATSPHEIREPILAFAHEIHRAAGGVADDHR